MNLALILSSILAGTSLAEGRKDLPNPHRELATIPTLSCDPSQADNTIIYTGEDSQTLANLALDNTDDGYLKWATEASYDFAIYIATRTDVCKGMGFHWTVDENRDTIQIAVVAQIGVGGTGWAAVGFSENGGMRGADVVYFTSSAATVVDSHIFDFLGRPIPDDIQDWTMTNHSITDDGYLIFEAERKIAPDDVYNRAFVDDSSPFVADHRIIGAWGSSDNISYHGSNRVQTSVQLFDDGAIGAGLDYENFLQEMDKRSDGSAAIGLTNYNIPTRDTTYIDECYEDDDLIISSSRYIVGYEFIIDPESAKYMHHMVVYGNYDNCDSWNRVPILVWTRGEDFLFFPEKTGMKYGGPDGFQSFMINYHFDNKDGDTGKVDNSSGVRFYYVNDPVENEIGLMQVGDPFVGLSGTFLGSGLTRHTFSCPSSCTQRRFQDEEITIIKEMLHMHAHGKRIENLVLRDGSLIHETYIDYWDFDQSGSPAPPNAPFQMERGDTFQTICYYDATSSTRFELGSDDEMCMAFVLYFPIQEDVSTCGIGYSDSACRTTYGGSEKLSSEQEFRRVFGNTDREEFIPSGSARMFLTSVSTIIIITHGIFQLFELLV